MNINEMSLPHDEKMASFTQTTLLGIRKIYYDHIKLRFLLQSAEYLGRTLSRQEIESLLDQKIKSIVDLTGYIQMRNNKTFNIKDKAFTSTKWVLTALSGLLTTTLIIILETNLAS